MKLSGEATINAPVDRVYAALNDPAVLVRTIPGCQRLEQTGPDTFKATVAAGVASVKGTFDGDVRLSDQQPPDSMTLHAAGAGAPGTVSAVARVTLSAVDGGTLLRYDADATIGGVIGGVGQRMLSGVARKTANEFFAAVERDLAGVAPAPAPATAAAATTAPAAAAGPVEVAVPAAQVWTRPVPVEEPGRQRMRDLLVGATFGAAVALLGVLLGALVSRW
jgi:carbon monoxide dehydrogenase subunit G